MLRSYTFPGAYPNRHPAIPHHPNHLQITLDIRYQYAIMVSLSRHDPSACPPKEGALRTMLARLPRASMGHEVLLTSITLRFVSASHFGTHLISSISLSFHTLTGTPFCNPFVSMVFHLMGGCTPAPRRSSRRAIMPLSPLSATLMNPPATVANKRLTAGLSPLSATLTKNRGWGGDYG